MKATILDTKTGEISTQEGVSSYQYAEEGRSCDCNRHVRELDDEMREELGLPDNTCEGAHRFLVIAAEFDNTLDKNGYPIEREFSLYELNEHYPDELLEKHGIAIPVAS